MSVQHEGFNSKAVQTIDYSNPWLQCLGYTGVWRMFSILDYGLNLLEPENVWGKVRNIIFVEASERYHLMFSVVFEGPTLASHYHRHFSQLPRISCPSVLKLLTNQVVQAVSGREAAGDSMCF